MKREEAIKLSETAISKLTEALKGGHSETLKTYLKALAKFHNYSFGNVMMIAFQKPEASHVAGYQTWRKLGRQVIKGEKGIAILAPLVYRRKQDESSLPEAESEKSAKSLRGFRVVHVFDISQTEGDDLPEFATIKGDPGQQLARMRDVIHSHKIPLEYEHIPGGALGVSEVGTIRVRPDLEPAEEFAVLVHELAHELLHKGERRKETTKTVRETEAEAVSFVVSEAFGLDTTTRSSDYIQLYRGDEETLTESLDFIQKTSASIIQELSSQPVA